MGGQKKQQLMDAMRVIQLKISLFLLLVLVSPSWAGNYINSAHGDPSFGVKRIEGYGKGNCGHCHAQHASLNGQTSGPFAFALFSKNFNNLVSQAPYNASDNVCFLCHGPSSVQVGGIVNFDYSKTYGGTSFANVSTILEAFNLVNNYSNTASYHNLKDIYDFSLKQGWNFFKGASNPCVACHNPHLVKRIKANANDPAEYTVVSLPVNKQINGRIESHFTLWGDNSDERMSAFYPGHYQAPFYYASQTYEPGSLTSPDYTGDKLPDYVTFCTSCHNNVNTIYSTNLGRNLRKIDWFSTGSTDDTSLTPIPDKHGKYTATGTIYMKSPYSSSPLGIDIDFVTSCTDCHEPHGSPNPFLLRTEVNGVLINRAIDPTDNSIGYFCRACHKDDADFGVSSGENRWETVHHLVSDAPYPRHQCHLCHPSGMATGGRGKPPIPCLNCHKHGYKDTWTGRICF